MNGPIAGFALASALLCAIACQRERSVSLSRAPETTVASEPSTSSRILGASPRDEAAEIDEVTKRAEQAALALQMHDMKRFAALVDPKEGVRFTPYGYIDETSDVRLTRAETDGALADGTIRNWGAYDGSGDPIRLTFAEYFKRFVYDVDFSHAPQMSIDSPLGSGNSINNVTKLHPRAHIVEWHFGGFDPKFDGMDWSSLRMAFEKDADGNWWIVAVIHDQWTI